MRQRETVYERSQRTGFATGTDHPSAKFNQPQPERKPAGPPNLRDAEEPDTPGGDDSGDDAKASECENCKDFTSGDPMSPEAKEGQPGRCARYRWPVSGDQVCDSFRPKADLDAAEGEERSTMIPNEGDEA